MNRKRGFVKLLVSLIIALIVLSYFGFDLRSTMEAPKTQENLRYFWGMLQNLYFNYLVKSLVYIWDKVIIETIWNNLVSIWQIATSKI
jgi:hypothetical protein